MDNVGHLCFRQTINAEKWSFASLTALTTNAERTRARVKSREDIICWKSIMSVSMTVTTVPAVTCTWRSEICCEDAFML